MGRTGVLVKILTAVQPTMPPVVSRKATMSLRNGSANGPRNVGKYPADAGY